MASIDSASSGYWRALKLQNNAGALNATAYNTSQGPITPDVTGMGLKDAVYLLENKGFKVSFTGKGKVATQSYMAGLNYSKGQNILLMLN